MRKPAAPLMNASPSVPLSDPPAAKGSHPLRFYRGISKSLHFIRRAQERGLREDVLEFILEFGTEFYGMGALHLTVLEKDLPPTQRRNPLASKARDWIVVCEGGDQGITCYRRKNAAKFLKRKPKTRLSDSQLHERKDMNDIKMKVGECA